MELNFFRNVDNNKLSEVKGKNKDSNKKNGFEIEKINTIFTTDKTEERRSKFSETFEKNSINNKKSEQGKKFHEGLIKNKSSLMKDLNLSDDEYDSLACVSMALASQETGMGIEQGYITENTGSWGELRKNGKEFLAKFGGSSASSGLTQIKIFDFMKDENSRALLKKYGVEASSAGKSNLFTEPDKAAVASMLYLSKTTKEFIPLYENSIETYHEELKGKLDSSLSDDQCLERGKKILNAFESVFNQADTEEKSKIRDVLRRWILSKDNSKLTDCGFNRNNPGTNDLDYCEGENLSILSRILDRTGVQLETNDINYVRYLMTTDDHKFDSVECCAYAWHHGAYNGLTPDRFIAEKLGLMYTVSDNAYESYYTDNVKYLTNEYAEQSGSNLNEVTEFIDNYLNYN